MAGYNGKNSFFDLQNSLGIRKHSSMQEWFFYFGQNMDEIAHIFCEI